MIGLAILIGMFVAGAYVLADGSWTGATALLIAWIIGGCALSHSMSGR